TKNKTSIPLNKMNEHQEIHTDACNDQGGIVFILIRFRLLDKVYILQYCKFKYYWHRYKNEIKKSITVKEIRNNGYYIPYYYQPILNYLKTVDKLKLDESEDRV